MTSGITDKDKRKALEAVCESELFSHLDRLCAFLKYIVGEELAGRGELIMGKTIAQDVYDRDPVKEGDANNVVRVDARRLRQNLEHYYDTVGTCDPVRIFVDTGGYRPRFEQVETTPSGNKSSHRAVGWAALSFVVGTAIGVAIAVTSFERAPAGADQSGTEVPIQDTLARQAVIEQSASSLQAMNLASQARSMMFPLFDAPRQQLVAEVFNRVIELGPDFYGGYAGAAQALGALAILTPPGPEKKALIDEAAIMADNARRLAPADPWAQSAQAWVKFANRDFDEAMRISTRAATLAPEDEHVLDIHGSIALFSGHFDEAADAAAKAINGGRSNQRFANRNIYGAANFHLGNYRESLESFSAAAEYGDPISAPSFAYQTAALYELGKTNEAARKYAELRNSWPDADVEKMLAGIFRDPSHVEKVMRSMRSLDNSSD